MKVMLKLFFILAVSITLLSLQALAQTPDAEIEQRAHKIGEALRCVVCQNQSIDESNAPLAADMRLMVRDRIRAGDSNAEVIGFMRERYGDFVLLKPPLQANTILLWFLPFAGLILLFVWYIWRAKHKRQPMANIPLSENERAELAKLRDNQGDQS